MKTSWWHSLVSVGMAALTAFTPTIQTAISHHPALSGALAFAWAIFGHILPSPTAQPPATP